MAQEQRFELVSTLGRGGMAEVFLGWMNSIGGLRRKVAIKRILPELIQKQSKLFQKMFVDEARLAFRLEHDNIVRVYDVGQTASTYFIVMEYVEGYDLKTIMERLRESGTIFPLGVAIYITLQVCAGLGYAHALTDQDNKPLGLIHNDISPPNILIGRHGEVKVADFGLSDARSNDVSTPEGMIKGKFAYISPESTRNPPKITSRSDIFSIGICLWEMLAGRRLFQRDTDIDTFRAVCACEIPDLRHFRNDIPVELMKIVNKSLSSDPDTRYQTCEEFYLDLSSVATGLNIPINRFDLAWLVNDLHGNDWTGIVGDKVAEDVQRDLEDELGGMLAPGDAEMLVGIVTGISEAVEVVTNETAQKANENWLEDVFSEVGFDEDEVVFADKKNDDSKTEKKPDAEAKGDDDPTHAAVGGATARRSANSAETPRVPDAGKGAGAVKTPTPAQQPLQTIVTPTREVSDLLPSAKSRMITHPVLPAPVIEQRMSSLSLICLTAVGVMLGLIVAVVLQIISGL